MKGLWTKNAAMAAIGFTGFTAGVGVMTLTGCAGKNDVIATINGERITQEDFYKAMEKKTEVEVVVQGQQVATAQTRDTLGYQAFQDLLRKQLVLQMSKDLKVYPSDEDVNKELEFLKESDPNLLSNQTAAGRSVIEIKDTLRLALARERILTNGIKISALEVDRYIERNPQEFKRAATAEMLWVVVRDKRGHEEVDTALRQGQQFSVVSERYGMQPNAKTDQRFPQVQLDAMDKPVRDIAEKLTVGKTFDWLALGTQGFAKFYLEKKTPASEIKIDDLLKERVRRNLAVARGMQATDLDTRLLEKMKASKITVTRDGIKERWERALEELKALEDQNARTESASAKPEAEEKPAN